MGTHLPLAFINNLFDGPDLLVIVGLGILLFGRRLPEVGRNLGQAITGFKKGLHEVESEVKEPAAARGEGAASPRQVEAPPKAAVTRALPASEEP